MELTKDVKMNMDDMEMKLKYLGVEVEKIVRLKISPIETNEIWIKTLNTKTLRLEDQVIKKGDKLCYLGRVITPDGGRREDIIKDSQRFIELEVRKKRWQ